MSGFYKAVNGRLLNAVSRIHAPTYTLLLKNKADAVLPDGWKWFDTDDAAYTFFSASSDRVKILLHDIDISIDSDAHVKLSELSIVLGKGELIK